MSYARRGYGDSDVYVYEYTGGGFYCDDCPRLRHHWEPTALTMAVHLVEDRMWGWLVPQDAIDSLAWEHENPADLAKQAEFFRQCAETVPDATHDTSFTLGFLRCVFPPDEPFP